MPPPPSDCVAGCIMQHGVEQVGGERAKASPNGLTVASATACCAACAADASCAGWIFREKNESTARKSGLNCWPMRELGEIAPAAGEPLARTIGMRRSEPAGAPASVFSRAALSVALKSGPGVVWRPGDSASGNLGGTISSWNEVHPRNLLNGTQSYQPGVGAWHAELGS